jgi:hypothetical protein
MSQDLMPTEPAPAQATNVQPSSANPAIAGASAAANPNAVKGGQSATVNSATQISSIENLKEQSPEFYNQWVKGLAQTIVNKMQNDENHRKEIAQQYANPSG